jgi:hypothetical protein
MEKDVQDVYVMELAIQSTFVGLAQKDLNKIWNVYMDPNASNKASYAGPLFRNLHSMLTHAGNISKMFWPIVTKDVPKKNDKRLKREQAIQRGEFLRSLYSIDDSNPLAKRELRDHLEHFDERLDAFVVEREASTTGQSYADLMVGPKSEIQTGVRPDFIIRNFNQYTLEFTFRGVDYNTKEIDDAVQGIYWKSAEILGYRPLG